jgi:hypothetical protein
VLDVWPELHAGGILCLPNDVKPGEKRPVVVCHGGLGNDPRNLIEKRSTDPRHAYFHPIAGELADRGFITFSPYSFHWADGRFRILQRKANPLGASLYSIMSRQHEQILKWLGNLPCVDPSRIAFYGLSYGGKTAIRMTALLDGYTACICSGDFNDWVRKVGSLEFPANYMFTGEWEIFGEWDLGHTFNHAEMAYLVFPRPFMVERGHDDGVGFDSWVAAEYAKVRYLYDVLGLDDRTEIEFFNGGHAFHAMGTYRFLHRHLRWPAPAEKMR